MPSDFLKQIFEVFKKKSLEHYSYLFEIKQISVKRNDGLFEINGLVSTL